MEHKASKEKAAPTFEEKIDTYITDGLLPFHSFLSKENIKLNDPKIDLAVEKIGQAMTVLQARNKQVLREKK